MHWVERAGFVKIRRLLEISELKWHHEILLTVKNLHDLSLHLFLYKVLIIPHPPPSKIVEGDHFVTADLLSLIPGSSYPTREVGSEAAGWELVVSTQLAQPSSASEDSGLAPQALRQVEGSSHLESAPRVSKKKKGALRRHKVSKVGGEGFNSVDPSNIPPFLRINKRKERGWDVRFDSQLCCSETEDRC